MYLQRLDQKTAQLIHLQRVTMEHNVCMRNPKPLNPTPYPNTNTNTNTTR